MNMHIHVQLSPSSRRIWRANDVRTLGRALPLRASLLHVVRTLLALLSLLQLLQNKHRRQHRDAERERQGLFLSHLVRRARHDEQVHLHTAAQLGDTVATMQSAAPTGRAPAPLSRHTARAVSPACPTLAAQSCGPQARSWQKETCCSERGAKVSRAEHARKFEENINLRYKVRDPV